MKKYKVLLYNMKSPFEGFKYKLGKEYTCKDFDCDKNKACSAGFYATDIEGILYTNLANKKEVFECEVGGNQVLIDQFKQRFSRIKLIRNVPTDELKSLVKKETDKLNYNLYEAMFPINPFKDFSKQIVNEKHIELLKVWASVRDSVWASVWASVRDSVSVRDSAWASVSVRDSVWAYISSLFPNIKKWKYMDYKEGENPFQSCIDLWKAGLVPSCDGALWRLHSGPEAAVVWKGLFEDGARRKDENI